MPQTALGIDYGTSSTVAVVRHGGGKIRPLLFDSSPLLPSAVFVNNSARLVAGRDAEHSARLDPARYEPHPKRRIDDLDVLLGERAYPVPELVAAALSRVRAEALRTLGGPPGAVTMTCPATWGTARRQVLLDAAALAGLPTPALVAEPVAAATYFAAVLGHTVAPGQCVVVYDLGAGTFDVSVVQRTPDGFRDLSCRGLDDVGGIDLDALVVAHARTLLDPALWARLAAPSSAADLRHTTMLWTDARHLRETLSRESSASLFIPVADQEVLLTRQQFETAAEPVLRRTVDLALTTLREARVRPESVAGWFLVGGGTRTPLIATMLHRATGVPPTVLEEPQLVVAEGALHLAELAAAPVAAPPPAAPAVAAPFAAPLAPVATTTVGAAEPISVAMAAAGDDPSWPQFTPVPAQPTARAVAPAAAPAPVPPVTPVTPVTPKAATTAAAGFGTGFGELFALVGAGFAVLVLLLGYVQFGYYPNMLIGALALAAGAGWRAWRLRRPGPKAADWAAVVLAGLGALLLVLVAVVQLVVN
ncbi:Hsp70 family protein [Dactylosporangium sp. AC04546]|uniref:Hsp70 family protein n=1 Tax=Dactylosporangium sp. AC04546 TaxID=2862460 RepID=UPI002E7B1285|nr:Hsp70 family protein [Dactylosporangium sp. AC04546]WVK80299.1 Hsp70 family protein [Dactylosporangium sp. AC04546]